MGGALAASGSPPGTGAPGGASDNAEGEDEYLSREDLDLGIDKVPLIHKDWENQFIFREDFGQSFSPPTDVSPTRMAPPMEPAPALPPPIKRGRIRVATSQPPQSAIRGVVSDIDTRGVQKLFRHARDHGGSTRTPAQRLRVEGNSHGVTHRGGCSGQNAGVHRSAPPVRSSIPGGRGAKARVQTPHHPSP